MFEKDLILNTEATSPLHICQFNPIIPNCLEMEDEVRECAQCKDTYYSKENECVDCQISNCRTCEE